MTIPFKIPLRRSQSPNQLFELIKFQQSFFYSKEFAQTQKAGKKYDILSTNKSTEIWDYAWYAPNFL